MTKLAELTGHTARVLHMAQVHFLYCILLKGPQDKTVKCLNKNTAHVLDAIY